MWVTSCLLSTGNFSPRGRPDLIPIGFGNRMEPWVETPVAIVQIDIDIVVDLRGNQLVFTS